METLFENKDHPVLLVVGHLGGVKEVGCVVEGRETLDRGERNVEQK